MVLTAFISPFESEREMARNLFEKEEFVEVFVDTPLEVAEARDPKGLYKSRAGVLRRLHRYRQSLRAAEITRPCSFSTQKIVLKKLLRKFLIT